MFDQFKSLNHLKASHQKRKQLSFYNVSKEFNVTSIEELQDRVVSL